MSQDPWRSFARASFGANPALASREGPANGPTLILLHGVARNSRDWEPLLAGLLPHWRVVALDHRGHGGSERAASYLVADYARDAAAFVAATCSEPAFLMGHSLGAMAALAVAAECPEHVAGIVLEDPPFHTMGRDIGATPYQALFAGMGAVARGGGSVERLTDGLAAVEIPTPQGVRPLGELRDRASLTFSAECLADVDPAVFAPLAAGRWLEDFDHAALWSRVRCPAALLQGDAAAGGALSDADADHALRSLSHGWRRRFPGVGHHLHRTCPAAVVAALMELREWRTHGNAPSDACR